MVLLSVLLRVTLLSALIVCPEKAKPAGWQRVWLYRFTL
ncbi:hypothetical protein DDI_3306 [Dickeya dianthicola RNS04.9]|nr:hypothetical protein DDI_3306 [Dickeya dianthicola RNS04.9]